MDEYKPLVIKVPVDYIPSVNQMFAGRSRNLSDVAIAYKFHIYDCLSNLGIDLGDPKYQWIYEEYLSLEMHFILKANFHKRDTDNMIKFSQDVLFGWLDHNDTYVTSVSAHKFFAPSSDKEYVIFVLKISELDTSIYEQKLKEQQ